jgi:thiol:disulfide interchange protein
MHIEKFKFSALLVALVTTGSASNAQNASKAVAGPTTESNYIEVRAYDPARNAGADIEQAIVQARKTGKNILLEVGGDWCPWCHKLDEFFQKRADVREFRDTHFIAVDVYYGSDNKNEKVLSRYSKVVGIPHFFVLDRDGNLLYSQHAVELQTNGDYNADKLKQFLSKWSPSGESAPELESKRATTLR